jgi:hypothetical protein
MDGTIARTLATRWWLRGLVFAAVIVGCPVAAQDRAVPAASARVRAVDKKAADLLRAGKARSETFRLLTETIERSDLIVYVETRRQTLRGQLQFASASAAGRYLRVSISAFGLEDDILPWLAHELWHAVELAGAPEVRDRASLRQFYERVGGGFRAGGTVELETIQAQQTQDKVLGELRRPAQHAR